MEIVHSHRMNIQIKIYKMALCTTAPTRPTTSDTYDVSSCVDVINSPDGQDVNLAAGSEMTLSDVTRPAMVLILMAIY